MSTQPSTDAPKVFISYSWKPVQNQQKVIELAERLSSNGVHVILDVWDLKEGHDKYQFMERMVTDPDMKRVLLICNKDYKERADGRKGGVGTESTIVSGEVYAKADQTKFIPLLFEYDEQGKACLPVFAHGRIYLDFSDEEIYEDSYEQLLRNIFDAPSRKRPVIGTPPTYITDKEPTHLPTAHRIAAIKTAFANDRKNAPLLVKEYFQAFLNALEEYEPKENEFTTQNYVDSTLSKIEQIIPLRDDFARFLDVYCNAVPALDKNTIHNFFEKYAQYYVNIGANGSENHLDSIKYDYLRFFTYELLLYFVAALIRHEQYDVLGDFLHDSFTIVQQYSKAESESFTVFGSFNRSLNEGYNTRVGNNRNSVVADKIKERAHSPSIFEELKQADMILHVVSILHFVEPSNNISSWVWRPETSVYGARNLPFFAKLVSMRYYQTVKAVLGTDNIGDIKVLLTKVGTDNYLKNYYSQLSFRYGFPRLETLLDVEKIGTFK